MVCTSCCCSLRLNSVARSSTSLSLKRKCHDIKKLSEMLHLVARIPADILHIPAVISSSSLYSPVPARRAGALPTRLPAAARVILPYAGSLFLSHFIRFPTVSLHRHVKLLTSRFPLNNLLGGAGADPDLSCDRARKSPVLINPGQGDSKGGSRFDNSPGYLFAQN